MLEDNPYGPDPTPTYPGFWSDAQSHLLLDAPIPLDCPVTLLQGQADADVPWQTSLRLVERLTTPDVLLLLSKTGDHRLSSGQDIARLLAAVEGHLTRA